MCVLGQNFPDRFTKGLGCCNQKLISSHLLCKPSCLAWSFAAVCSQSLLHVVKADLFSAATHKPVYISELVILLPKPCAGLIDLVCFELPYHNDRSQSFQNTETISTFTAKKLTSSHTYWLRSMNQVLMYLYLGSPWL